LATQVAGGESPVISGVALLSQREPVS